MIHPEVTAEELDQFTVTIEAAGHEVFWYGPANPDQITSLEARLGAALPRSFSSFLTLRGGGGVIGAEVSGIWGDDDGGGTVWGDTAACRKVHALPDGLAVIYFHGDEVCWCLDLTSSEGAAPVVSYALHGQRIDRQIAPDFATFLRLHLNLYTRS